LRCLYDCSNCCTKAEIEAIADQAFAKVMAALKG